MNALKKYFFLFLVSIAAASCNGQVQSKAFETTINKLLNETVDTIGVVELKKKLGSKQKVLLFDAREKKEFNVSHIKGARYIGYDHFNSSALNGVDSSAQIVVYCSIGYRSEKVGEKLDSMGYHNVLNLYGGIFEWVNQGGEVEANNQVTQKVHGFDSWWSKFLRKGEVVLD